MMDSFKGIEEPVQAQIVEKKSKFICCLYYVETEEQALEYVQQLRKKYYDARHHCFAFSIGLSEYPIERFNDDKEPSGTAGKPILEVIKGAGLRNVLAVVIRYFGGVLLGTGGLIKAYTEAVKEAIANAEIYESRLCEELNISVDYSNLPKIQHLLGSYNEKIYQTEYLEKVSILLYITYNNANLIKNEILQLLNGDIYYPKKKLVFVANTKNKIIVNKIEE